MLALSTAALLVATACGSTVPQGAVSGAAAAPGGAAPAGSGGLGIPSGSPGSGTGKTSGGGIGGSGSTGGGTTTGGRSTIGGGTGGAPSGGPSISGGQTSTAPGITPTTIYVGAIYTKNVGAANAAIGGSKRSNGDARDDYNAVIDDINRSGGIAGRKVVPFYAPLDATSSTPIDAQEQAACATWTQDHKVFAILAGGTPIYEACARKAGAVELWSTLAGGDSVPETFRSYPNYVEIAQMNLVRMGFVTVDGLAQQGYFDKGAKIGIVTWDDPGFREGVEKGYVAALARHGLALATAPVYLTPPQTVQDLGATSAQVNSAVLKFQSTGVDHVILLDGSAGLCGVGCIGLEFMNRAKAQHYYPRYGLNDNNAPVAGQQGGSYPSDELRRSVSVAWTDIDKSYDTGWHRNIVRDRCYALMRKHGVAVSAVDAQSTAIEACDELWFLQAVATKIGGASLTTANVIAAVNAFGSDYTSTSVYGTHFSSAQHDGLATVRNMRFVDSCTCFRYTSAPYRPG